MRNTGLKKVIVLAVSLVIFSGCAPAPEDSNNPSPNDPLPGSGNISNQPPVAVITPGNEQYLTIGEALFLSGSNSYDADNNIPLTYQWTFSGSATSMDTSETAASGIVTFEEEGTVNVELVVTDSLGQSSDPASLRIFVFDASVNRAPNGFIMHDNGTGAIGSAGDINIATGTSVEFDGDAVDPDGDPVSYSWNFPANVSAPVSPGSSSFYVNFPTAGVYLISLTVSDNQGNTDATPAQVTVTVTDSVTPINLPPDGTITHDNGTGAIGSTGNIIINTGGTVMFDGIASDPENDPISYAWNFPTNVSAPASPGGASFNVNFPTAGVYLISLTVSDNQGNTDPTPAQVTVTVTDPAPTVNLPPDGSITHDNGSGLSGSTGNIDIRVGATVVFQGSATDPENDAITYSWQFTGGTATST